MTQPVKVGLPKEEDLGQVADLFREVLVDLKYYNSVARKSELAKYSAKNLARRAKSDIYSIVYAYEGTNNGGRRKAVVGFLFDHYDDGTIWMDWIGVRRDKRKEGVAGLLLNECVKNARKRGCHKIWCDCRTTNRPSIAALTSSGFKKIARVNDHWYGQDFYLWQKFL